MRKKEELAGLLKFSAQPSSVESSSQQPSNEMSFNQKSEIRAQSSFEKRMEQDLESSRLKMLNTFKRTQNSLLQASAVELVESSKNMTLGRPLNQLNLDKARSQTSL